MSDDLISRKAVLDILTEERIRNSILASSAFGEMLAQRIKNIPTAFDKKKVIEKIKDESSSERFEDVGISGNVYGHYSKEVIDTEEAIEIVEKGGIE